MSDSVTMPPQHTAQSIRFYRQGSFLTTPLVQPATLLDGVKQSVRFGANTIPVAAGHHRVEVVGHDTIDVLVEPGRDLDVYFAPPWTRFNKGVLSLSEAKRPGYGAHLTLIAVMVVVFAALAVAVFMMP